MRHLPRRPRRPRRLLVRLAFPVVLEVVVGVLEDMRPVELLGNGLEDGQADVLDKVDLAGGDAGALAVHKGRDGEAAALLLVALAVKLLGDERDPLVVDGEPAGCDECAVRARCWRTQRFARVGDVGALDDHLEHEREVLGPGEAEVAGADLGVEARDDGKVARHVGGEDEIDDDAARRVLVLLREVLEHAVFGRVQQSERFAQVVVLEHGLVVVEHGKGRLALDKERVSEPRVVDVVARRGEKDRKLLDRAEPFHERRLGHEVVQRLEHVGRVHAVVVADVGPVALLERGDERREFADIQPELVDQVVLVRDREEKVLEQRALGPLA
eukprot:Unigene7547_Nuclearia_a/m.23230 Unigene7547_Nuclearia_a/g.23230  ORF Unigene7547_Nuclearia_a/g.23230 Unigene7547_Nuclearia_a/m.23230 type:complete len:328 (+) Unigene7547_Nuclearia_a:109-1092(+)